MCTRKVCEFLIGRDALIKQGILNISLKSQTNAVICLNHNTTLIGGTSLKSNYTNLYINTQIHASNSGVTLTYRYVQSLYSFIWVRQTWNGFEDIRSSDVNILFCQESIRKSSIMHLMLVIYPNSFYCHQSVLLQKRCTYDKE